MKNDDQDISGIEIYKVYQMADEDDADENATDLLIGTVECDAMGMLTVMEALPERESFLRSTVEGMNSKPSLSSIVPPVDGGIGTSSETAIRGTPEFIPCLREHLIKYFGLLLG